MQIKQFLYILLLSFFSCKDMQAQEIWKKKFGVWINVELSKRINEPFDSTAYIMPRFLWLRNLKELEIEQRYEQKRKYAIKGVNEERIALNDAYLFLAGDTIVMKDSYSNVAKFIRYE